MLNKNHKTLVQFSTLFLLAGCSSGEKWSNEEKNSFLKECQGQFSPITEVGKLQKKFCECNVDFLSKDYEINELSESDEYAAMGLCTFHISKEKMQKAIMKDMRDMVF